MTSNLPAGLLATLLLVSPSGGLALAQERPTETASVLDGKVCLYDGREFSQGAEICMRQNRTAACSDGHWWVTPDDTCEGLRRP